MQPMEAPGPKQAAPITVPRDILDVFALLDKQALPAWLVGGCLRDLILGRRPEDWDFATPATPETVREKLSAAGVPVWDTGLKHGTLTFRFRGVSYEITTFRRDGPYEDFRRPKWVAFTSSLEEDLARRDFTVNAMAWHWKEGLFDPFDGMGDMERKLIRAVGSPEDRLQEDALRILRGIRFAGKLDFALDDTLATVMAQKAELLLQISPERLASELQAMLLLPSPRPALTLLARLRIWPYLAPEMTQTLDYNQNSSHHHLDLYGHTLETVENVPPDLALRLAALLHDVAKPLVFSLDEEGKSHFYHHDREGSALAAVMLDRLRFGHALRDRVILLIRHHMLHLRTPDDAGLRRVMSNLPKPREESLEQILLLQKADLTASLYTEESLEDFESFARRCRDILAGGYPLDLADLVVRGSELEGLGIPPASRGKAHKAMLAAVLRDPAANRRPALLQIAEAYRET